MAVFPLVLVVISAASSAIYKHYYSRKIRASVRFLLTKYHAFATELLQLLVLGGGISVGWGQFTSKTIMLDIHNISAFDFPIPVWFTATMTINAYILALFAIDLVDNRIQLGYWSHPVQTQTLLLTRSLLAPGSLWTIRKRVSKEDIKESTSKEGIKTPAKKDVIKKVLVPVTITPYRWKRTTSEPVTPEMLRRFLRDVPAEISKSGALIREPRAHVRRSSAAAVVITPTRVVGNSARDSLWTSPSLVPSGRYDVQSKVESIERSTGGVVRE